MAVNEQKALESRSHRFSVAPMMDRRDYRSVPDTYVLRGAPLGAVQTIVARWTDRNDRLMGRTGKTLNSSRKREDEKSWRIFGCGHPIDVTS